MNTDDTRTQATAARAAISKAEQTEQQAALAFETARANAIEAPTDEATMRELTAQRQHAKAVRELEALREASAQVLAQDAVLEQAAKYSAALARHKALWPEMEQSIAALVELEGLARASVERVATLCAEDQRLHRDLAQLEPQALKAGVSIEGTAGAYQVNEARTRALEAIRAKHGAGWLRVPSVAPWFEFHAVGV